MSTIRESFLEAIRWRRQYLDLVKQCKIRSFEADEHGRQTDVTDRMVADAETVGTQVLGQQGRLGQQPLTITDIVLDAGQTLPVSVAVGKSGGLNRGFIVSA